MTKPAIDFSKGDDLSDLLGGAPLTMDATDTAYHNRAAGYLNPHTLPMDEASVRIRETVPEFTERCPACHGSGMFKSWSGRTVGQCFKCRGKGSKTFKTAPEARAKSRETRVQRKESAWSDFALRNVAVSEWIVRSAPSFDFAAKMLAAVKTYGDLTENQLVACQKCVAREALRSEQKAQVAAMPMPTFPNLKAAFDALIARGVRKAQMTAGTVNVSIASWDGRNAGQLYVKDAGQYVGKIVNGTFMPRNATPDLVARLVKIEADPRQAVIDHAKVTAERLAAAEANGEKLTLPCGCCGLTLSDPVSVARGIGPICADKWSF